MTIETKALNAHSSHTIALVDTQAMRQSQKSFEYLLANAAPTKTSKMVRQPPLIKK